MIRGVYATKAYTRYPGWEVLATNPETGKTCRVQVKARSATDFDGGFHIKNFDAELSCLLRSTAATAAEKPSSSPTRTTERVSPSSSCSPCRSCRPWHRRRLSGGHRPRSTFGTASRTGSSTNRHSTRLSTTSPPSRAHRPISSCSNLGPPCPGSPGTSRAITQRWGIHVGVLVRQRPSSQLPARTPTWITPVEWIPPTQRNCARPSQSSLAGGSPTDRRGGSSMVHQPFM